MRMVGPAILAVFGTLACAPARADIVPPFKGNDTGGIIAYELATQSDVKLLAVEHCAKYGKAAKFLAAQAPSHLACSVISVSRGAPAGAPSLCEVTLTE